MVRYNLRMVKRLSTEQKEMACQQYIKGLNTTELARIYNVSPVAINGIITRRGVKIRTQSEAQRKLYADHHAFDNLNEFSEYWLGFIFADGSCVDNKNANSEISLILSDKDANHLEKFKLFLKSEHKISLFKINQGYYSENASVKFSIRSFELSSKLKTYGWAKNLGSIADKRLVKSKHFWRGVVDGDGCLGINKGKLFDFPRLELVGGKLLLEQFTAFVKSIVPENKATARPHKSIFRVGLLRNAAHKVIECLYKDNNIALDRKNKIAQKIIDFNAAKNIELAGLFLLGSESDARKLTPKRYDAH